MRLSQIHGKGIFDENATRLGEVKDILIDVEKGGVYCLLKEDASKVFTKDKNAAKGAIKQALVLYDQVKALSDIVLLGDKRQTVQSLPQSAESTKTEVFVSAL